MYTVSPSVVKAMAPAYMYRKLLMHKLPWALTIPIASTSEGWKFSRTSLCGLWLVFGTIYQDIETNGRTVRRSSPLLRRGSRILCSLCCVQDPSQSGQSFTLSIVTTLVHTQPAERNQDLTRETVQSSPKQSLLTCRSVPNPSLFLAGISSANWVEGLL